MQTILLLIGKISETDIEFSGVRIYSILQQLNHNHSCWKHVNYTCDFFLQSKMSIKPSSLRIYIQNSSKDKNNAKNQQKKQTSRIQETSFSIKNIQIILLFLIGFLSSYAISAFLIMKTNMDNSQPELNIAMNYVKFKQDLDGVIIIYQLLKSEQMLIEEIMINGIFKMNPQLNTNDNYFKLLYTELLTEFSTLITDMDQIYSTIYNDVIESRKMSEENKLFLLNLYQQDLCEIILTILPFCAYENQKFIYFPMFPTPNPNLNNKIIQIWYQCHILIVIFYKYQKGLYQYLILIIPQRKMEQRILILQILFSFFQVQNMFQQYYLTFFDLSYAILQFYYTIIQVAQDILEDDYQMILQFYIIAGVSCIIILYLVILLRAITLQQRVRLIRQTLIVIPHESLSDQQILNQIKKIDRTI